MHLQKKQIHLDKIYNMPNIDWAKFLQSVQAQAASQPQLPKGFDIQQFVPGSSQYNNVMGRDNNKLMGLSDPNFVPEQLDQSDPDFQRKIWQDPTKPLDSFKAGDEQPKDHSIHLNYDNILFSQVLQNLGKYLGTKSENSYQNATKRFNEHQFTPLNYLPDNPNVSTQALYGMEDGGEVNYDGILEELSKGGWIQKAVNPEHKGYCTPMTKSTCTPKRKAFAMTMKKNHGFHKTLGGEYQEDHIYNLTSEEVETLKKLGYDVEIL